MQKGLSKKHRRVIESIGRRMPQELIDKVVEKRKMAPATKEMILKALDDPEVEEWQKDRMRVILESGVCDREVEFINEEAEWEVSKWWDIQIAHAIESGLLPMPPKEKYIKKVNKKIYDTEINKNNKQSVGSKEGVI